MGEHTGLDAVSAAVLESLDALGARPDGAMKKSGRVVAQLYEKHGIPPRLAYDAICTNAAPWLLQVPLVDFNGNMGGPDEADPPAARNYTEVRLSPAGALAHASERGQLPRLPIGLINGDLAFFGSSPPFEPERVIEALRLAGTGVATDDKIVDTIGPPAFRAGCPVTGDFAALAAGERATLSMNSEIAIESDDRGTRLVISRVPYGVGPGQVIKAIGHRMRMARRGGLGAEYPDLETALDLPLRDLIDESSRDAHPRLVCELLPGADPESCRERLLEIWPVKNLIFAQLRAPLATLVRGFVDKPATQKEALTLLGRTWASDPPDDSA